MGERHSRWRPAVRTAVLTEIRGEPVYRVELVDCAACRDEGFLYCTGHRACLMHGAEVRTDDYLFALNDQDVVVTRIRDLVRS